MTDSRIKIMAAAKSCAHVNSLKIEEVLRLAGVNLLEAPPLPEFKLRVRRACIEKLLSGLK